METNFFIVIIAVVVLGIIIYGIFFSDKAIVKRKLKNTPYKPILQVKENEYVKIIGKVDLIDEPLIAPLSNRKCAHYFVHVEEEVGDDDSTEWRTLIKQTESCNYRINDRDAYAVIQTQHIKNYIVEDCTYKSGTFNDAKPQLEHFLQMHGHKSTGFLGLNKTLRYKEGILEPDEMVAVCGTGNWKSPSDIGFPDSGHQILVLSGTKEAPVYLSDDTDTTAKNSGKRQSGPIVRS